MTHVPAETEEGKAMNLSHDVLVGRAQRGYAFLRDEGPRLGFNVNLLDPDTLDLSSSRDCAIGQTYEMGGYWDATERLGEENFPVITLDDFWAEYEVDLCPTYLWERMHGFRLGMPEGGVSCYSALTDAWREVIKRERDQ